MYSDSGVGFAARAGASRQGDKAHSHRYANNADNTRNQLRDARVVVRQKIRAIRIFKVLLGRAVLRPADYFFREPHVRFHVGTP